MQNKTILEQIDDILGPDNDQENAKSISKPRNKFMDKNYEQVQNTLNQLYLMDHSDIDTMRMQSEI